MVSNAVLDDFRNFLYLVWKHLGLPDPTPIQYEIAYWLQHGETSDGKESTRRKVLEAFRGVGKSWITSAYVVWKLLKNPQAKFLVVSASSTRANDFSTFTKRLIHDMSILQHLKPKNHQRDSNIAFDVAPSGASHAPSVKSVGIFGQMTGSRADEIIADDVEVPNNSYTQDMREKLFKRIMEFESILKPNGKITFLGTPQTEESIYNKLRDRGFTIKIWTARYPSLELIPKYEGCLAQSIVDKVYADESIIGKPTDPDRFDEMDLLERENAMGRSEFSLQFMLDTSLSDANKYPLKLKDLIAFSLNKEKAPQSITWTNQKQYMHTDLPSIGFSGDRLFSPMRMEDQWLPYESSMMAIDPSGRGKDETTYAVVKQLYGNLYLTKWEGLSGGYDKKTLSKLSKVAQDQQVNQIIIEDNFGDGMFTELFKPILNKIYRCGVEEVKHNKQKERRIIDTLEPVMNQHRLIVSYEEIVKDIEGTYKDNKMVYSLLYQMTRLTKARGSLRHDDRVDVLAMAVQYWTESMARDNSQAIEDYKEEMRDEELRRFMEDSEALHSFEQTDIRYRSLKT